MLASAKTNNWVAAWVVGGSRAIYITKAKGEAGNKKAVELRLKMCVHRDLINRTLQITFGSLEFISIAAKTNKMLWAGKNILRFVYVFVFFKNIHFKSLEAAGIMYLQSTILREVKILMHYFSLVIMSI